MYGSPLLLVLSTTSVFSRVQFELGFSVGSRVTLLESQLLFRLLSLVSTWFLLLVLSTCASVFSTTEFGSLLVVSESNTDKKVFLFVVYAEGYSGVFVRVWLGKYILLFGLLCVGCLQRGLKRYYVSSVTVTWVYGFDSCA